MQNRNEIIGGEFDLDLFNLRYNQKGIFTLDGLYKYSTGRSALYYILLDVKHRYNIKRVLMPDYLCTSVVFAAKKADVNVSFYPLDENLEIDKEQFANLYDEQSSVLVINYFGLQKIEEQIDYIHSLNKGAIIIEDDVQGFYDFQQDRRGAEYRFTSLRKTFACTDGGLVKTSNTLPIIESTNRFHQYKLAGSILKSFRRPEYYEDEVYLTLFEKGESMIDKEIAMGMSNMSMDIISNTDTDRISYIRRRNAKYICEGLETLGIKTILPILDDKTPLFIPIYLKDRDKVRKYMFQHNCFCPIHWPLEGLNLKKGAEMAEHELSIIIDQRYTSTDMLFILNLLESSI